MEAIDTNPEWTTRITKSEVDCGQAVVTEYLDSDGKVVRRDTNIIVDPEKLPKMGSIVGEL